MRCGVVILVFLSLCLPAPCTQASTHCAHAHTGKEYAHPGSCVRTFLFSHASVRQRIAAYPGQVCFTSWAVWHSSARDDLLSIVSALHGMACRPSLVGQLGSPGVGIKPVACYYSHHPRLIMLWVRPAFQDPRPIAAQCKS